MLRPPFRLRWPAVLALLAACSPLASTAPMPPPSAYHPSPPGHRGGSAVVGAFDAPDTLDPLTTGTDSGVRATALMFAPLWGLGPGLTPYPDLASDVPTVDNGGVKVSGSGMTIDVRLVRGLRWSDGAPITSDDVIFTWRALTDPVIGAQATLGFDAVSSIDRRSDTETLWHLDRPEAGYLLLGAEMSLLPAHRLSDLPRGEWAKAGYFRRPDVVSGPFAVDSAVSDTEWTFVANPHYVDGRSAPGAYSGAAPFTHPPYLDRIVYRVYPSKDALLQGLRAGGLDAAFGLGPEDVNAAGGGPGVQAQVTTGLRDEFANPNHDVNTATGKAPPWVGDPAVLDALALAVDRSALVSGPLGGAARASRGLYPSPLMEWDDPGIRLDRDVDAARKALDADGWPPGPDGVRVKNGQPLRFSLLAVCPTATLAGVLDALKRQWTEIGASVQTDCRGRALFFAGFKDRGINATGAFDMTLYSNQWAPDPAAWVPVGSSADVPTPSSPAGLNWNRCRDSRLDAQLERVAGVIGAGRRDATRAAEREWLAYHCTIPLFEWPDVQAVASRLHGVVADPGMAAETWNATDWWLAG